jgi:hypothetical protein
MVEGGRPRDGERVSVVMVFDIHAGAVSDGRDRHRVDRLCRYLARPPIAQERLVEIASRKLRYADAPTRAALPREAGMLLVGLTLYDIMGQHQP